MTTMITGATRGIGLALVKQGHQDGKTLVATYRGDQKPQDDHADWYALDVTDAKAQRSLAAQLSNHPLELLVCNAGVYLDKGHRIETGYGPDLWAQTFAVNVTGAFLTIQAFLPHLRAGRGKIAILSSQMASDNTAPGGSYIYRASKAAALNLGRNLATDLRAEGIPLHRYPASRG